MAGTNMMYRLLKMMTGLRSGPLIASWTRKTHSAVFRKVLPMSSAVICRLCRLSPSRLHHANGNPLMEKPSLPSVRMETSGRMMRMICPATRARGSDLPAKTLSSA